MRKKKNWVLVLEIVLVLGFVIWCASADAAEQKPVPATTAVTDDELPPMRRNIPSVLERAVEAGSKEVPPIVFKSEVAVSCVENADRSLQCRFIDVRGRIVRQQDACPMGVRPAILLYTDGVVWRGIVLCQTPPGTPASAPK